MSSPDSANTFAQTRTSDGCCEVYVVDADRVARAAAAMPPDPVIDATASLFKIIAHSTRVRILLALAAEELCVCDLAQVLGATVSATSHQLRTMRMMGLVRFRAQGKLAYYRASDPVLVSLLRRGVEHAAGRLPDEGGR